MQQEEHEEEDEDEAKRGCCLRVGGNIHTHPETYSGQIRN